MVSIAISREAGQRAIRNGGYLRADRVVRPYGGCGGRKAGRRGDSPGGGNVAAGDKRGVRIADPYKAGT